MVKLVPYLASNFIIFGDIGLPNVNIDKTQQNMEYQESNRRQIATGHESFHQQIRE